MSEEIIAGRNSVAEAIKAGRSINKIMIAAGDRHGSFRQIIGLAKERGLIVQEVDSAKLALLAGGLKHQGIVASVSPVEFSNMDDILAKAEAAGEPPFLLLLDELEDPHNVGAIIRTADAAGVHGVLMPKRRSCPLSGTVARTSAGAVEHVPVAKIGNVAQTLSTLKQAGLWVIGADMDGNQTFYEADLSGPIVVIIGSEGQGIGRLNKEQCDMLVRIPMRGKISSLNASVAASLLMYEVFRQREMKRH